MMADFEKLRIFEDQGEALDAWIEYWVNPSSNGISIFLRQSGSIQFFASTERYTGERMEHEACSSRWVERNSNVFHNLPSIGIVYDSRPETGYQCLAAISGLHPGRLNIRTAMGLALTSVESSISEPRIKAIKKAIALNEPQVYSYRHEWDDKEWQFDSKVIPLGDNEILVLVNDPPKVEALWQQEYWIKKLVSN